MLRIINEERIHKINRCLVCGKELKRNDNYCYNDEGDCICLGCNEEKNLRFPFIHNAEA